jgi:hypothetical protein
LEPFLFREARKSLQVVSLDSVTVAYLIIIMNRAILATHRKIYGTTVFYRFRDIYCVAICDYFSSCDSSLIITNDCYLLIHVAIELLPMTELELMLRQQSQRLRVVKKLSAGAHLLLPGSETTIAVRVYGPEKIQQLELSESQTLQARQKRLQQVLFRLHNVTLDEKVSASDNGISYREEANKENTDLNTNPFPLHDEANHEASRNSRDDDYDVDGLKAFRDTFKYPVVFFIIPRCQEKNGLHQLYTPDSFLNRAQRALLDYSVPPGDTEQKKKDAQDQGPTTPLPVRVCVSETMLYQKLLRECKLI